MRRLKNDGWTLERVKGSHHVFKYPKTGAIIILPHPRKDLGVGLIRAIYKQATGLKGRNNDPLRRNR